MNKKMRKVENLVNQQYNEIEDGLSVNKSKQAYNILKALTKTKRSRSSHTEEKKWKSPN